MRIAVAATPSKGIGSAEQRSVEVMDFLHCPACRRAVRTEIAVTLLGRLINPLAEMDSVARDIVVAKK